MKSSDNNNNIYAVDTKNSSIMYRYKFNDLILYDLEFDASFDMNVYISFLNGKTVKMNLKTGTLEKFEINYSVDYLSITNGKIWAIPNGIGIENKPKEYYVYDPLVKESEYITIPEGIYLGRHINLNENCYFEIVIQSTNWISKIYNYSQNRIYDVNLFNKYYSSYRFGLRNYAYAIYEDGNRIKADVYYINSFEPLNVNLIFVTEDYLLNNIFEKDNFIYFITCSGEIISIFKTDKTNNYKIIKSVNLNNSKENVYCKNGYIWCVSEDNDGAYKVNMDDLSYEVIN
ncbi:MAG: hypothetical protein KA885_08565 [Spirochaetes bacterium]|nr:hypothetical protein [Spirochaetota bacterium]